MAKFDNAKVGDNVWSSKKGWGKITKIDKSKVMDLLEVTFLISSNYDIEKITYTFDGRESLLDLYPTLFWNEVKLPTDEEDKKPFDLVNFLRESLKVKKFIKNEDNYYLIYHHKTERLEQQCNAYAELDGVCFNFISIAVMEKLNKEKITIDQLKQAYKTLGWL